MSILYKIAFFSMIVLTLGYSDDCIYTVNGININDNILALYMDDFAWNNIQSQIDLFTFQVIPNGNNCSQSVRIEYTLKIYAPEIGLTRYETFYIADKQFDNVSTPLYLHNSHFNFVAGPTLANNAQAEKLISYISQSGTPPNGKYLFQFLIENDSGIILDSKSESLEINKPQALDLLSPGGILSELTNSYTFSNVPLFTWYSDYCHQCSYGIRVCEYNQDEHSSLQDALADWSLLPWDQSKEYHDIPWASNSFQYPVERHLDLEKGRYYVWQIRRSYNTTLDIYYNYSPIYVFEVRSPSKEQLNFADPYLSVIQTLIGDKQFNLWFSPGGELERFTTHGRSIWINNEELNIDALYSLSSELKLGKIRLEEVRIK